jgi:hypothetical protein
MRIHAHAGIPLEPPPCAVGATLPRDALACPEAEDDGDALLLDGVDSVSVKFTATGDGVAVVGDHLVADPVFTGRSGRLYRGRDHRAGAVASEAPSAGSLPFSAVWANAEVAVVAKAIPASNSVTTTRLNLIRQAFRERRPACQSSVKKETYRLCQTASHQRLGKAD